MLKLFYRLDDKIREINDATVLYAATVLIFLHYTLAIAGFALLLIHILFYKTKKIFNHKSSAVLLAFTLLVFAVSIFYRNYLGFIVGVGFVGILMFLQFARTVITVDIAEKIMKISCKMFLYTALYAIIEFIVVRVFYIDNGHGGRAASVFFNPNYYGTVCAIMIVIALYKLLNGHIKNLLYYFTIIAGIIGLILCMSVFSFMEVAIGIGLLLYYTKHRYLLALYLCLIVLGLLAVYFIPALFTRFADIFSTLSQRVRIWRLTFIQMVEAPLFGKGPMTYNLISPEFKGKVGFSVYVNYHAHNLVLDSLINYGFVGTGILLFFVVSILRKAMYKGIFKRNTAITALIKSIAIAMLCHSMVDITVFWVQTGLLYAILFSFIGALDKLSDSGTVEIEQTTRIIE